MYASKSNASVGGLGVVVTALDCGGAIIGFSQLTEVTDSMSVAEEQDGGHGVGVEEILEMCGKLAR